MAKKVESYLGNPNLKKSGVHIEWTEEMMDEWARCYKDPVYFTEKYVRIIHVDRGVIPFMPYDYQKEIIETIHDERFTIVLTGRQAGKCLTAETQVKLKNKKTGEVITMSFAELYNNLNKS